MSDSKNTDDERLVSQAMTPQQKQEFLSMQEAGFEAGRRGDEPKFPDNEVYMQAFEGGIIARKLRPLI